MNIAFPGRSFESDSLAVDGFIDLIKGGFENPEGIRGAIRIYVPEHPEQSFIANYGPTLAVEKDDPGRAVDTEVEIPIATIHRIFREFEYLDWRDPSIIGTVSFSGNLGLANHLAKPCIRPSSWTQARFRRAEDLHRSRSYHALDKVEHLHRPSQRMILKAISEGRPLVVSGLEPEPPCKDWTLDKLAERFGNAVVRVRSVAHRQTMAEFVGELQDFMANPHDNIIEGFVKPYTEGANLPNEMWADFGPLFVGPDDFIAPQLWLGAVPTHIPISSLHRDPLTGFLFQVMGRKRLDLYSADQAELLSPMKAYNNYQPCWFKPEGPDYKIYPRAEEARCISVTLEPGQLLLQPEGWFHQVYALDSPNMSVSYFWRY